jgi:two-component system response regulator HydG
MKAAVLLIDDDPLDLATLRRLVESWGIETAGARSVEEGLARLSEAPADAVLSDVYMPGLTGEDLVERLKTVHPGLPVVLITGRGDVRAAVRATKAGAFDYVLKPPDEDELRLTLERAVEQGRLRRENRHLRAMLGARGPYGERLVACSPAMQRVAELVERVARADSTVLVTGETGTGKELVAQAIHFGGPRAARPFVIFNGAALPAALAESELFGHERGAFTGAVASRRGRFEEADGGTLALDEVGDMPADLQAKLLRVLEERRVRRVGGSRDVGVDVRILALTNRDLAEDVRAGRFREDLYYRLRVVPIHVPPLRERAEDVPVLAEHFLREYASAFGVESLRFSEAARAALSGRAWPGNVRELRHLVERAAVLARGPLIEPADLVLPGDPAPGAVGAGGGGPLAARLEAAEREHLVRALDRAGWNKQRASRELGIDRTTLHRLIRRHSLARKAAG